MATCDRDIGFVGAWGVSNFDATQLRGLFAIATPALVQNSYSLLDRGDEREVLPLCFEFGVAYQAFSPLAGGWLTGKYRRGEDAPPGSRMTLRPEPYAELQNDRVFDALDAFEAAAVDRDVDCATLALAWLLASPLVSSIVVGPRRPQQLAPVFSALDLQLSPDEATELAALFP